MNLIKMRRSIKTYLPNEVPKRTIYNILDAGRWAPSAHNAQPWRFIVVTDSSIRRKLAEAMASAWDEDMVMDGVPPSIRRRVVEDSIERFAEAPVLIIASVTMEDMDKYPDERRQKTEHTMATQSLAAAVQNMLLAAHSVGLGSCWFCAPLFCQDVVRGVLKVPDNVEPQALVTLGYPSQKVDQPPRKPLGEVAFRNSWGEEF